MKTEAINPGNEERMLEEIRQILLHEDRAKQERLEEEVELLKGELLVEEKFNEKLNPYFGEKVVYLKENFPELFGPFISTAIRMQIRDSQDEVIDALYPIIGKLIRRYIKAEIEKISQKVDEQFERSFTFQGLVTRVRAWASGVKYEDYLMQKASGGRLEEIFLVDTQTGLLRGHYSLNNLADPDMIAGMLTGIKSFVEHAFMKGEQELQTLEYDRYKILVVNFQSFYFACVLSGPANARMKEEINERVLSFAEKYGLRHDPEITKADTDVLSGNLSNHFQGFNEAN